jgi:hypothetical protein
VAEEARATIRAVRRFAFVAFVLIACGGDAVRAPAPRPPTPRLSAQVAATTSASTEPPPPEPPKPACEPLKDLGEIVSVDAEPAVPAILDPSGEGMARFYARLAELVRGTAKDHVRIAMYGDSNLVTDFITGGMRRTFQKKFGDAGHGFVALAKPWNSYVHMDVKHDNRSDAWIGYSVSSYAAPDAMHGLGLVAAQNKYATASTWVSTADDKSPVGRSVQSFEVFYLKRPGFGAFEARVDGELKATIDTNAAEPEAAFEKIVVPDGPHKAVFSIPGGKPVRFFGVALERDKPSVVIDAFGAVSLTVQQMATRNDPKILLATLAHRKYDLVIYLTGTNEWFGPVKHKEYIERLIAFHREATPGVSVLFMSPPDRVENIHSSQSTWSIKRVGSEKREFSTGAKAAFWDFREAMGGEASIVKFRGKYMCGEDLVHFTQSGGFYMADRIVTALWRGLSEWTAKHATAGCEAK